MKRHYINIDEKELAINSQLVHIDTKATTPRNASGKTLLLQESDPHIAYAIAENQRLFDECHSLPIECDANDAQLLAIAGEAQLARNRLVRDLHYCALHITNTTDGNYTTIAEIRHRRGRRLPTVMLLGNSYALRQSQAILDALQGISRMTFLISGSISDWEKTRIGILLEL